MKWLRTIVLFEKDAVIRSEEWRTVHESVVRSIQSIDFPTGAGTLTLRRKHRRADGQWERNGVVYLKQRFVDHMVGDERCEAESSFHLGPRVDEPEMQLYPSLEPYREPITSGFGDFDLIIRAGTSTTVAIEWETGNISSSHRSMNKLAIALSSGSVQAGVLIVPSRSLYEHMTDRIGNIGELSGYLGMWRDMSAGVERGLLAIAVVEQDELTSDPEFPYLPTGRDGRARQGAARRV